LVIDIKMWIILKNINQLKNIFDNKYINEPVILKQTDSINTETD